MAKEEVLYQHFSTSEKAFVEKAVGWCQQVERHHAYQLTTFLNPKEEKITKNIAAHFSLKTYSSRELLDTESVRLVIAPDYYIFNPQDLEILALEINYPRKFHRLTHAQILGAMLNQLGIRREYLGDILLTETESVVLLDQKFGQLVQTAISKIAHVPVVFKERAVETISTIQQKEQEAFLVLLSSLRLDKVIAAAYKLSRSQAVKLIEAGSVKVAYVETKQASCIVEVGQLISVRGFGRIRIKEILGYSKHGKIKVNLDIIKK